MTEADIKKKDWEDYIHHWKDLQHPIVPGKESIERYEKLIKKHILKDAKDGSGKKILLLGPTWQIRDLLAKLKFHVTCVDISTSILEMHSKMCLVKERDEKLITADWLKFVPDEKFDAVIGDAANFQFKEESYDTLFGNVKSWLKQGGISIQLMEGNYKNIEASTEKVLEFIKNATDEELEDYRIKAYYYLANTAFINKDKFGNVVSLEKDILPLIEKEDDSEELRRKFDIFSLHMNNFSAALLPVEKIEAYLTKQFQIVEKIPYGPTTTEECFYWLYVIKPMEE